MTNKILLFSNLKVHNAFKYILLGLAAFLIQNVADVFAQKKVSYDGYFEIGGKSEYDDIYIESYYKVKLETEFEINENTKIEIDMRSDSEDREMRLYEASASIDITERLELEIGDLRKRFGIEEWTSREKLPTIRRSMINRYFEPLGYVNREPGIQLEWKMEDFFISCGIHYNESHAFTFIARGSKSKLAGFDKVFAAFQTIRTRDGQVPHSSAFNGGLVCNVKGFNMELEAFYGQDPIESYYSSISGEKDNVYFSALKTTISKKFSLNSKVISVFEPLLLAGILVNDIDYIDVNRIQVLLGINIYFNDNTRLMINGDLILSNHFYNKSKRTLSGSNAIIQLQIRW